MVLNSTVVGSTARAEAMQRLGPDAARVQVLFVTVDPERGVVTFTSPPDIGAVVSAGFEFDVPVRFDIDRIDVNLSAFDAGRIPSIPITEILP